MMVIMSIIAVMLSSWISPAASRSFRFLRASALRNISRCSVSSSSSWGLATGAAITSLPGSRR